MQNSTKALSGKNYIFSATPVYKTITGSYNPLKRPSKYHFFKYKSSAFYCLLTLAHYLPIIFVSKSTLIIAKYCVRYSATL